MDTSLSEFLVHYRWKHALTAPLLGTLSTTNRRGNVPLPFGGCHFLVSQTYYFFVFVLYFPLLAWAMCSGWLTEFTKRKVVVMRTQDWKSGNLNSRLRKASAYNMILDKLGAYFGTLISPMVIMRRLDQRSQRDLFPPGTLFKYNLDCWLPFHQFIWTASKGNYF